MMPFSISGMFMGDNGRSTQPPDSGENGFKRIWRILDPAP